MKNTIKIAIFAAVAAVGLAACTNDPAQDQSAAPVPQTQSSTAGTSAPPPPAVTETVTATVTNPPKPQAVTSKIDNRTGYGSFKLGMTLEEARAAGLTDLTWGDGSGDLCVADDEIAVSKSHGIERITLPAGARTSKGIGVGSTFAEVKRAYPNATEYRAGYYSFINDSASYLFSAYTSADTDEVEQIKLTARHGSCALAQL